MKKIFLLIFVLLTASVYASPQEKFEEANRAFAEGKYANAIETYQKILDTEGASLPLLDNLANAQFRAGQTGKAILNYRRAQYLFYPRDPDIFANLRVAEYATGVAVSNSDDLRMAGSLMTWNGWSLLSFWTLLALCLLVAFQFWKGSSKRIRFLKIALILLFIFSILGIMMRWPEKNQAVVISEKATVRISPFETAEISFPVRAGEIVMMEDSYGDFVSIRNRIGKPGWILKNQVEKIIP